jgi:hypothetical protein
VKLLKPLLVDNKEAKRMNRELLLGCRGIPEEVGSVIELYAGMLLYVQHIILSFISIITHNNIY